MYERKNPNASREDEFTMELHDFFEDLKNHSKPPAHLLQRLQVLELEPGLSVWRRFWGWMVLGPVVAMASLFFAFSGSLPGPRIKPKGAATPQIEMIYARKTLSGYTKKQKVREKSELYPGDLVQFVYNFSRRHFVMIASINQKGVVSLYVPFHSKTSRAMAPGQGTLPREQSLELDDYVGLERVFALVSTKPISFSTMKRALKREFSNARGELRGLQALPGPWHMAGTFLLKKRRIR